MSEASTPLTQPSSVMKKQRIAVYALAGITLAAGAGVGLLALFASLGVWAGWWDFRRGFDLLRMANDNADWISWSCLALSGVVLVLTGKWRLPSGGRPLDP